LRIAVHWAFFFGWGAASGLAGEAFFFASNAFLDGLGEFGRITTSMPF
jgi:hypothetical protein